MFSRQETSTIAKPQIKSKAVATKPKQATPIAPVIKPKVSVTTNKVIRPQPMRAVHQVPTKKPVAEKNVMNTIHNVTVASPPSVRKVQTNSQQSMETRPTEREQTHPQLNLDTLPRERTKTRTLEPEEVVILKPSQRVQETTNLSNVNSVPSKIEQPPLIIQQPVAFEITFEKAATSPTIDSSSKQSEDISDGDYEDDFDSYESDFETESSTESSRTTSTSSKSEDDSNSTNSPTERKPEFTVAKKLDEDRDFDSGTFELKGTAEKVQLDSIDERELHSEGQNDSGFG